MNHVIKTLEDELQALDTRVSQKRKSKENLESQAHDLTVEIYQIESLRNEVAEALHTLSPKE